MAENIDIIVVNFNGEKFLENCLSSLMAQTCKNRIILVDNASQDGSLESVESNYPNIEIIRNDTNLGFAKGVNLGIEHSNSRYIATLNNDTIADPFWLENLVNVMESDTSIGICASKMYFMDRKDILNSTGHAIYRGYCIWERGVFERDVGQYDNKTDICGACAAAALYRRELFQDIGYFDEDYFMYNEDVDLSIRAMLRGWKIKFVPKSIVYHVHSGSTSMNSDSSVYYNSRNLVWTIVKDIPTKPLLVDLPWILFQNILSIGWYITQRQGRPIIKAKFDAILGLPKMIKKRKKIQGGKIVPDKEISKWIQPWRPMRRSKY